MWGHKRATHPSRSGWASPRPSAPHPLFTPCPGSAERGRRGQHTSRLHATPIPLSVCLHHLFHVEELDPHKNWPPTYFMERVLHSSGDASCGVSVSSGMWDVSVVVQRCMISAPQFKLADAGSFFGMSTGVTYGVSMTSNLFGESRECRYSRQPE